MTAQKRLPKAVANNMIEFFRRQYVLHGGEFQSLGNLGTPSEMRATKELGLATVYGVETPRILNWYSLTPKGQSVLDAYIEAGLDKDSFEAYGIKDYGLYQKILGLKFNV